MIRTASTWVLALLVASPITAPCSTGHLQALFAHAAAAHVLALDLPAVSIAVAPSTGGDAYTVSPIEPQIESTHDSPLRMAARASSVHDAAVDDHARRWQQLNQSDHQASARPAVLRL